MIQLAREAFLGRVLCGTLKCLSRQCWSPAEGREPVPMTGKECAILLLGYPLIFFSKCFLSFSLLPCVCCMCVQTCAEACQGWSGGHCGADSLLTPSVGSGGGTQVARLVQQTFLHQPNLWSLVTPSIKGTSEILLASHEPQTYGTLTCPDCCAAGSRSLPSYSVTTFITRNALAI